MASAKIVELDESNTCKICDNALAKYSCPRCNIIYCSLTCYQAVGHSDCSENFYKENVMSELGLDVNSPESKAKMLEILQRTHEKNKIDSTDYSRDQDDCDSDVDLDDIGFGNVDPNCPYPNLEDLLPEETDSDDDNDFVDLAERLAGIHWDDSEGIWEKLTTDERQDFVAFLKNEDVSKLIPSWKPWWLYNDQSKVTEMGDDNKEEFKSNCPQLGEIKDFSTISNKVPSDCVKYNLINLLAAYVFTCQYFNGEHFDFPNEALATVATISLSLKMGQNFEDFETAVKSVEQECINCEWIITDSENLDLMREDLTKILKGPNSQEPRFYVLCALTDFYNLLKECQKPKEEKAVGNFSKLFPNDQFPQVQYETKQKVKKYLKKTEYFLSYAKDLLLL